MNKSATYHHLLINVLEGTIVIKSHLIKMRDMLIRHTKIKIPSLEKKINVSTKNKNNQLKIRNNLKRLQKCFNQ